ncbi:unnamed protein product [Fructobacillus evanidus]|uniref:Uncharacterized protein n=1 Tax=Fructobacillus evanidus TaxID=3064281 RepID=A0ABN9Z311_9LACO|nr:unnamed protein product [Fructobacillus sp. LMG 32999]CAK1246263.1 unnamed protein product [Fructobacillus sp. LMG 32999]CAK1251095.1 unnamed protein product [Fructobacillus sp. LMG 32999]CAK1251144.1 unnamed protein product [Fructobacillus sp. LMG 32999]CAK1251390.1 unnamed protein product [Fructobacillus sp. LMG 32999]
MKKLQTIITQIGLFEYYYYFTKKAFCVSKADLVK